MERAGRERVKAGWLSQVLTDIHFWVPVTVLLGGLLLLSLMR